MSALAITRGTALRIDTRLDRPDVARGRTPFQKDLAKADARAESLQDDRKPAPRKIPTKAAKKVEPQAPSPDAAPRVAAPEEPTLAAGTGPIAAVTATGATPSAESAQPAVVAQPPAMVAANTNAPELALPLSPLEQALQDLVDQIQPVEPDAEESEEPEALPVMPEGSSPTIHMPIAAEVDVPAARPTHRADAPAPVTDLEKLAELQATQAENASHVNLVIDDGDARIVLAVAVHGQDVRVAMRAGDDHLAASLARNAASLDHALHARGLDLAELANESNQQRDPNEGRSQQEPQRERPEQQAPHFRIEEYV